MYTLRTLAANACQLYVSPACISACSSRGRISNVGVMRHARRFESTMILDRRASLLRESRLSVVVGCITDVAVDAIVNAANEHLVGTQLPYLNLDGSGGCIFECVDRAVHRVAGPSLHEACMALSVVEDGGDHRWGGLDVVETSSNPSWGGIRCPVGHARTTAAFDLPHCKCIIHAVGPSWPGDADEIRTVYQACIDAAVATDTKREHGPIRSVAVPALSSGAQQWPRDMSWAAAVEVFGNHLLESTQSASSVNTLNQVVFAAWNDASAAEVRECLRLWTEGKLTEDGLL